MFQFSTRSEVRLARSTRPGIEQDSDRVDASSKIAVVLSRGLHGGAPRPRVHRRLRPGDRPGLVKAPRGALVMLHTSHVTHCHTSHWHTDTETETQDTRRAFRSKTTDPNSPSWWLAGNTRRGTHTMPHNVPDTQRQSKMTHLDSDKTRRHRSMRESYLISNSAIYYFICLPI